MVRWSRLSRALDRIDGPKPACGWSRARPFKPAVTIALSLAVVPVLGPPSHRIQRFPPKRASVDTTTAPPWKVPCWQNERGGSIRKQKKVFVLFQFFPIRISIIVRFLTATAEARAVNLKISLLFSFHQSVAPQSSDFGSYLQSPAQLRRGAVRFRTGRPLKTPTLRISSNDLTWFH
jgi:hypothetical protein